MKKEVRFFPVELRVQKSDNQPPVIRGYAAVFDSLSDELYGFREKVAQGAFTKTLKKADVRALFNHDPNYVLGRNKAGTLTLGEEEKGLAFEVEPPDTQWARDLMVSMERGDISQCSFGFRTVKDQWDETDPKNVIRTLLEVELFDVSVVTYPAYPKTDAQVRSAKDIYDAHVAEARAREAAGIEAEKEARARETNLLTRLNIAQRVIL